MTGPLLAQDGTGNGPVALLPFSTPLLSGAQATEARLRRLVAELDAVRQASVVLSEGDTDPHLVITVTWRTRAPRPQVVALIRDLALATVAGLDESRLTIADTSGRLLFARGVLQEAAEAQARGPRTGPAAWSLLLTCVLGMALGAGLATRPRHRRAAAETPAMVGGRSAREVAALLSDASPAVRGAVLASLPQPYRRAVQRRVKGAVQEPPRPPAPQTVLGVLAALAQARQGDEGDG